MMTSKLEQAVERLAQLPEPEQNRQAQAILDRLDRLTTPVEPGTSAYELIQHVAGSLEGPGDMSHNPAYLDDLGQRSLG